MTHFHAGSFLLRLKTLRVFGVVAEIEGMEREEEKVSINTGVIEVHTNGTLALLLEDPRFEPQA